MEKTRQHSPVGKSGGEPGEEPGRRRFRIFAWHLGGYFLVVGASVLLNLATGRETPWFLILMLGWGLPLALHAAWVMGLIGRRR